MYGRIVNTFIFPMGGAAAWHDEDGKVPGYRKIRSLLPNMMIRNSSIYAMKSVPDRTTKNNAATDCTKIVLICHERDLFCRLYIRIQVLDLRMPREFM